MKMLQSERKTDKSRRETAYGTGRGADGNMEMDKRGAQLAHLLEWERAVTRSR